VLRAGVLSFAPVQIFECLLGRREDATDPIKRSTRKG